ncbi:uroporphyrinogen-III C-methyltransferase [Chondrinema litorale]|uniref:uroporphyrinogen-III C-methyltransferase n=1 Tax=Chondrinema litorale TaxID=2994555 RepID=UPI002543FDEB|nr:uroporphyrinogen-III C-methyltransferase [Chondrinema litorale]UZR93108.1 uroporphyrinogen-III C-methyltransferase [Chondrinema litorale]
MNINAKLSLVGAGPGDPELFTVKGINTLKKADVVLYDALVSPELLDYAPEEALKVFVGKRAGKHHYSQDEINELIIQYAFSHGHVVRLKGGDPFIFGRGHEEKTFVERYGIPCDIVPGISSATSLATLQQIPLTKRHITQSFWVTTATNSAGKLTRDIHYALESSATLVILMGMGKLNEITRIFESFGKADMPIAIINNGSLESERVAVGTIKNICEVVKEKGLGTPATIIIGEVVRLHPEFLDEIKITIRRTA